MMFVLVLNDMRCRAEQQTIVAAAETREALVDFVARESVDSYKDGRWGKVFRRCGPLEWFNRPGAPARNDVWGPLVFSTNDPDSPDLSPDSFGHGIHDVGTAEDAAAAAAEGWREQFGSLPRVDEEG